MFGTRPNDRHFRYLDPGASYEAFRWSSQEIQGHVRFLGSISRIVEPACGLPVILADPHDDPVLYTAVAAGADVLCVKDRDFYDPNVLAFCKRQDIELMDDVALLRVLSRAGL